MKKYFIVIGYLLFFVNSLVAAKAPHPLNKIIQQSPTAFMLYCINPYDCPNCYIGYQLVKKDLEPYFSQKYWLFPGNVDSADVMYFMKLHFNFTPCSSHVFFDDSLYKQYCPGQASMNIFNKGKIVWSSTLHDLQFGDYPKIKNDSDRIVLLQQKDISKFIKNQYDKFCLINDSLAIVNNSLRGDLSAVNIKTGKTIKTISTIDSLFIEHLISLLPLPKTYVDSNLIYFHTPTSIFKKYYINPLRINNFQYDGKNVWIGISLNVRFVENDSNDAFMPYGFFLKCNDSLNHIEKIYALANPRKNNHWDTDGLWANNYNFSIIDSNSIYLPILPGKKSIWLGKYLLNNVNNRVELKQAYKMKLPDELPKKYMGMDIGYTVNVDKGVNNSIFMFTGGLDIYRFYDSTQTILYPSFSKWGADNNVNAIINYEYLPTVEQSFVVLYNQEMSSTSLTTPIGYYYCFLDKNYIPIENKPSFFANNASFTKLSDGTLQVITKDSGEYILKIYKVF